MNDNLNETLTRIRGLSVYALADDADAANPDSEGSAGALLLSGVRDAVVEAWELNPDGDPRDVAHEVADMAPSVYTHTRWQEFVDLAAYREDPSELGFDGDDMTASAAGCLYLIAHRLASALWQELEDASATEED